MERDFGVFDEGVAISTLKVLTDLVSESNDLLQAQDSLFNNRSEADFTKMAAQVRNLKKTHEGLREQLAKNQFKTLKEIIITELGERKVPAFKNRELPEGEENTMQAHLKKRKLDETRTAYMLSGNMLQWEGDELAVRFETFYLGSYYEHYYIFLKFNPTRETFSIKHHTIPFFIPLDATCKKYLNSNFKICLEKIKHYLSCYVARREQVAHLSECTAIDIVHVKASRAHDLVMMEALSSNRALFIKLVYDLKRTLPTGVEIYYTDKGTRQPNRLRLKSAEDLFLKCKLRDACDKAFVSVY